MLLNKTTYSYNDIAIVPSIKSDIEHRSECKVLDENGFLPIFTAPMSTVVCEENVEIFEKNHIIPIIPRNISYDKRMEYLKEGKWVAFGLNEFEETFIKKNYNKEYHIPHILIDIANGHMTKMHSLVRKAKEKYCTDGIIIMVGNVANPHTYEILSDCGADYVRFSIGSGGGCITSTQVGIHYGIATLLSETYEIKKKLMYQGKHCPKIIADGGCRGYCDVVKALALGADYIMCGSIFAKLIESAAPTYYISDLDNKSKIDVDQFNTKITHLHNNTFEIKYSEDDVDIVSNLKKVFYGMASAKGQIDINGKKTKTSEGNEKVFDTTENIEGWVSNMISYFQSAMSYTNCNDIRQLNPDLVDCIILSPQTKMSINK